DWESTAKADIVYHLAAITFVPTSQSNPRATYHINVTGTINALEFCRLHEAKLVFASSYVYGNPSYLPVDEKHPVNPTNPYARSKVAGELLCRAYSADFGVRCVVLRPFNIFGPGQRGDFLIPEIVQQIRCRDRVTLKDLTPKRDLLYIGDAVDAYIKAAAYDGAAFDIFNVGYGQSFSVQEIAEMLIRLSGKKRQLASLDTKRRGEISETVADIHKAKELLHWQPVVDIGQGLGEVLKA
ncbi:MAG: NAD-dependent epimerase/dehydratase family protein, partial [Candidatus Latescibacterota bacterium]